MHIQRLPALRSSLKTIAGGVLVDEETEILHANRAASQMIEGAAPIRSARGKLSVADSKTAAGLRQANLVAMVFSLLPPVVP